VEILGGVLLILALPIMAIAGFVMAFGRARTPDAHRGRGSPRSRAALRSPAPCLPPRCHRRPAPEAGTVSETAPATETATKHRRCGAHGTAASRAARDTRSGASHRAEPRTRGRFADRTGATRAADRKLRERFGTKWVVWVGGLALALGGIFLVKYSIEAGLIGPGMRIFFGALLAAGLVVGAEWARRREQESGTTSLPIANIPAILTAAGTTVAYATVYAAYGLYGFLSPRSRSCCSAPWRWATLAAALLHGPALPGSASSALT